MTRDRFSRDAARAARDGRTRGDMIIMRVRASVLCVRVECPNIWIRRSEGARRWVVNQRAESREGRETRARGQTCAFHSSPNQHVRGDVRWEVIVY